MSAVKPDRLIRLRNETLHVAFNPGSGALALLGQADGCWDIMDRPGLGLSFRLLVPLPSRRHNYVESAQQEAPRRRLSADSRTIIFEWDKVRSEHGGPHDITVRITTTLLERRAVFSIDIDNRSELVVENVHYPCIGDIRPPDEGGELVAFGHRPGGASRTLLWPRFDNAVGFCSVERPTFFNVRANLLGAVGAPVSPFLLLQGGHSGLYCGVDEPSAELVVWHAELSPGWGDSMDSRFPEQGTVSDKVVSMSFDAVHVPYLLPGERRRLTDIALEAYTGDWHAGADVYTGRRDEWATPTPLPAPAWSCSPHSWQQIQLNSAEDSLRIPFAELPSIARECADRGVTALQVVGWNVGGQDRNNPSHDPDPRLGGADELRRAIAECRELGIRVVLFTKFIWADRASARFRDELAPMSIKDPYGDYYVFPGFRYDTMTQLLDINTRRLIPMCFHSEAWLDVCAREFATVLSLGADGMLHDEALHHSPALLCFDESHGHRIGAPAYARDREFVHRLRARFAGDDTDYLYAAEGCYDWLFEAYQLSYQRSNESSHVPLTRYLRPHAAIMTAITGFDDRNMINQCLLYRYIASYEPFMFKGRLTDFEQTVNYGQRMDALRTELREWFWDGTFRDTMGARVTSPSGLPHHPYAVYTSVAGRPPAVVIANYDTTSSVQLTVSVLGHDQNYQYRLVDDDTWQVAGTHVTLPPRSAAVVVPC